jgi:hypothetical protein
VAAAKGANSDKKDQQSSVGKKTKEGERKEQTNVGKFVHFQRSRSYCVNILCQILNRISHINIRIIPLPFDSRRLLR